MMDHAHRVLEQYFGFSSFRFGQEPLIEHALNKKNALGIMPTGGGKSLCYQIPGLLLDGTAVIISPLISLMKDQVDSLNSHGITATYINSSLSYEQQSERMFDIQKGRYQFVYVAPERFDSEGFIRSLRRTRLSLIAFDEAHCISQWGHDFRPSYRSVVGQIQKLGELPVVMGLTATATEEVTRDIQRLLSIEDQHVVNTGFSRDNLHFQIVKGKEKHDFIQDYIRTRPKESGIIYAATRKDIDRLHQWLSREGVKVAKYHAGLSEHERKKAQNQFIQDEVTVMVATNAFGMGIDKSNVRYVIHYAMPMNIESYYQEAGRAGRDGEQSDCILLFSARDIHLQKFLIEQSLMEDEKKTEEYQKLQQMVNYCHTDKCLQEYMLTYFKDPFEHEPCEKCSNCQHTGVIKDITREAQIILSCVKRMNQRYGSGLVAKVLKGSKSQKVRETHFHTLSTYGLLSNLREKDITQMIQFLVAEGYLAVEDGKFPLLKLTQESLTVLKGERAVQMIIETAPTTHRETDVNEDLFEKLRMLRKQLAEEHKIPPYVVFSDATLKEFCLVKPQNKADMLQVKGVGEKKFEQYGVIFLEALQEETHQYS
ncbi:MULTISPECIES: DNA helicase RecQ [Pontibacillus]|uniref:DNA helicase RecQ n=1 Tax=Pontibacillus chungwhensis TaxID=265426 RepID=A0ABY8UZ02_9BACI|nr:MULTISPECIES: DNA helicase RecQ [Pontibacillus]MCD5323938.1 DNA helicase RecQ [Pontibacillus sp. HN14]WIF97996.1 DNA helicase RecQ [Pontibacillus chungwhensis]